MMINEYDNSKKYFNMLDKFYEADSRAAKKKNFKGVKILKVESDVLTIEMGDGRKFVSPLKELKGTYHEAWGETRSEYKHSYKLQNENGEKLKINYSDWNGFKKGFSYKDPRRTMFFKIIESSPNVELGKRGQIEYVLYALGAALLYILFRLWQRGII